MSIHWGRREFLQVTGRVGLGGLLLPPITSGRAQWKDVSEDLEKRVPALLVSLQVPGASVALIHDAEVVWRRGFGVADMTTGAPVGLDTMFEVGSISKTVFAYAVMKLCERGLLDLDTPLVKYTPEPFLEGDSRLDLITGRHVLSHTTGFQNWRSSDEPLAIHFTPGERHSYSGEGYSYLQSVVTRLVGKTDPTDCATFEAGLKVCGTDFDAFMRQSVLVPFGMPSSGYLWNEILAAHMAHPHDEAQKVFERHATAPAVARYGAAGGLHTTPSEYAEFLIEVINPRPTDRFRLSEASLREMLRPQVRLDASTSWGLGWQLQRDSDLVMHGGSNPGFKSFAVASKSRKSGLVIATNGDNGYKVLKEVLMGAVPQRFLAVTI